MTLSHYKQHHLLSKSVTITTVGSAFQSSGLVTGKYRKNSVAVFFVSFSFISHGYPNTRAPQLLLLCCLSKMERRDTVIQVGDSTSPEPQRYNHITIQGHYNV